MELFFRKYQFPSKEFFDQLLSQTTINPYSTITELGYLVEEYYCVDTLWYNQLPEEWIPYEIWDVQGNGSHTYLGWDFHSDQIQ